LQTTHKVILLCVANGSIGALTSAAHQQIWVTCCDCPYGPYLLRAPNDKDGAWLTSSGDQGAEI